ncbi:MAG: histidine kinase, partial [SAR324 cluster bacterium]
KAYISTSTGTLGKSLRGFAPVRSQSGQIIGFISVGYLESNILETIFQARTQVGSFIFMMLFVGLIGGSLIAAYIKGVTLNMEPAEVATLHQEREIVLNSIREGIIAFNLEGIIHFANKEAERLIQAPLPLKGQHIDAILQEAKLMEHMQKSETLCDKEIVVQGQSMIFNVNSVLIKEKPLGLVVSFRRKDEIDYLNQELSMVNQCSDLLRVQSHEYFNKLHTIGGLLQIEEYDEAKDLILKESYLFQELMEYLEENVKCPMINGMLIGKFNKASELKCTLEIDFNGRWLTSPQFPEHLVTILGNLLDNAMDAVLSARIAKPLVRIALHESETHFQAIVEDNGQGIAADLKLFDKGVTTKADGRGIGLYNVLKALDVMLGQINHTRSSLGGAKFTVEFPKHRGIEC